MAVALDKPTLDARGLAALLAVVAGLLSLSGCGNGLAQVTGQVTLDGQPVRGGKDGDRITVQFQPADGVGANGVALADENGNYNLGTGAQFGVRPGEYVVTCSMSTLKPGGPVAHPKYANAKTSGLRFSVQSGRNEFNIPLQTAPKSAPRTGA